MHLLIGGSTEMLSSTGVTTQCAYTIRDNGFEDRRNSGTTLKATATSKGYACDADDTTTASQGTALLRVV